MALLTLTRAALALLLAGAVCSPFAQISQSAPEHEVKAAFLFNFTKFVTWPPMPANGPFRVCVVADQPTTVAIDRAMQDETILGRKTETIMHQYAVGYSDQQLERIADYFSRQPR